MFLSLRETGFTTQQHCDAFHAWLVSIGVSASHCSSITLCVAKKVDNVRRAAREARHARRPTATRAELAAHTARAAQAPRLRAAHVSRRSTGSAHTLTPPSPRPHFLTPPRPQMIPGIFKEAECRLRGE